MQDYVEGAGGQERIGEIYGKDKMQLGGATANAVETRLTHRLLLHRPYIA